MKPLIAAAAVLIATSGAERVQTEAGTTGLSEEKFNKSRVFTGVNANFGVLNVAVEAEKMGDNTSLSAKLGWRF
jgi:hypothetical protein